MKIYIGNLSPQATDADVQAAFAAFGQVDSAVVIKNKVSGDSRGFGFVEMPAQAEAEAAMAGLAGTTLQGQTLVVNEARAHRDERGASDSRSA